MKRCIFTAFSLSPLTLNPWRTVISAVNYCNLPTGIELIGQGFKAMSKLGITSRLSSLCWAQQSQQLYKYTTGWWRKDVKLRMFTEPRGEQIPGLLCCLLQWTRDSHWQNLSHNDLQPWLNICCSEDKASCCESKNVDVAWEQRRVAILRLLHQLSPPRESGPGACLWRRKDTRLSLQLCSALFDILPPGDKDLTASVLR